MNLHYFCSANETNTLKYLMATKEQVDNTTVRKQVIMNIEPEDYVEGPIVDHIGPSE